MLRPESSDPSDGNVAAMARRDFVIRWIKRLACFALAAALVYGALLGYGSWRRQHLAKQLAQFVAQNELQSGVLVARRLLELDQNNLAACTAMAEMAEKAGQAEAVVWRQRLAQLQPGNVAAQLNLARTALRFGQRNLAERIVEQIPEPARNSVPYHEIAGALALSDKQLTTAESHFAAAAQLEPSNPRLALSLAFVRLTSPDPKVAESARAQIAQLAQQPALRLEAIRALAADAVARKDAQSATLWAGQLRSEENATFADMLLCFHAFEGTDQALLVLEQLKGKAAANAATAAEFITWLNRNGMAIVAVHWSSTLPSEMLATQPVPLAVAEAYSFLRDWTAMQTLVEGKDWGAFEALRLAVESHALHHLAASDRVSIETQVKWHAAIDATKAHPEQLIAIAELAEGWGYKEDAEQAWWIVASGNENPRAGLRALQRLYKEKQDTRGLLRVAKRALELNPGDLVAANNYASFSLLLSGDATARRLALKLHTEHPENRAFAATYAFALQTEGKLTEALQLMETLKDEELRHPSVAAYYFVMLVESGKLDRARSYLAAATSASLLPEEQQLLSAATRKLLASEAPAKSVAQLPTTR